MDIAQKVVKQPGFKDSIVVIISTIISLILIEFSYQHLIDAGKNQLAIIVALLMIGVLIFGISKIAWRILDMPYFAVSSLLSIALATVIGTFILQTLTPEAFNLRYGEWGSRILRSTQLDHVFTSWWYVSLYILLSFSLIKMSSRRKFALVNAGFHLAHLSPIIVLAGFWVDHFYSYRGIIKLEIGEQSNQVLLDTKHNEIQIKELDVSIQLDDFTSEKFEPDYKIQVWEMEEPKKDSSNPHGALLPESKPQIKASNDLIKDKIRHIYGTDLYYRMLDFYPNFEFDYQYPVNTDTIGAVDPGVLLNFKTEVGEAVLQLKTKPEGRHILSDPSLGYDLEYYWELPSEMQNSKPSQKEDFQNRILIIGSSKQIYFVDQKGVRPEAIDMDLWYKVPNQDSIQFKFHTLYPDGKYLQSIPITKDQKLENPVVKVEVWGRSWAKTETAYIYPSKGGKGGFYTIRNSNYLLALESFKASETKYWRSDVSALNEEGQVLKKHALFVNEPMFVKGHRFYQTDYDPQNPNYSGIGVSYEPGLKIIYLGFFLLVLGTFLMFFTRHKNGEMPAISVLASQFTKDHV